MNALLGSIDVYASLHRAEGFGLGIAEAMSLGKPVIVTAYSGNMDYTTRTNSCLVGYHLRPIEESDLGMSPHAKVVYEPGLIWAEPNISQAARWMRYLYDHPEERTRIGAAGAATVRNQFNPGAIVNSSRNDSSRSGAMLLVRPLLRRQYRAGDEIGAESGESRQARLTLPCASGPTSAVATDRSSSVDRALAGDAHRLFGCTTCCVRRARVPLGSGWAAAPETPILRQQAPATTGTGAPAVSARSRLRGRLPPRRAVS